MPLRVGELLSACRCVGDASRDGGGSGVCRSPTVRKRKLTDSVQSCAFTAWFTGTIVRSSVPSSTWLLSLRDAAAALARAQTDIRRAGGVATAGRLLGHGAAARDVLAVGTRGSRPSGLDKGARSDDACLVMRRRPAPRTPLSRQGRLATEGAVWERAGRLGGPAKASMEASMEGWAASMERPSSTCSGPEPARLARAVPGCIPDGLATYAGLWRPWRADLEAARAAPRRRRRRSRCGR